MARQGRFTAEQVRQALLSNDSDNDLDSESECYESDSESEESVVDDSDNDASSDSTPDWRPAKKEEAIIPGFSGHSGILVNVDNFQPLDYFKLFLTDILIDKITIETNRYAEKLRSQITAPHSRLHSWVPTTNQEMRQFIGLLLLMALNRKPTMYM